MASIRLLASFDDTTGGSEPEGSLILDAAGNLYGTTYHDGTNDDGTVFEIAKTGTGYNPTPITLVTFNGANGRNLSGGLIADSSGNLYGTTVEGGPSSFGTVFEIAKTANGYSSTPTTLASFNGTNGETLFGSLIADASGNLYGLTAAGGANGDGTVFEIAKTPTGFNPTPITLATFTDSTGTSPRDSLIADAAGNLYGTTAHGGATDDGTVFEIAKTDTGYNPTPITLASLTSAVSGSEPNGRLLADTAGDLYGTTPFGGVNGYGSVFEIAKTGTGYSATPTVLVSFDGTNGGNPAGGLIADAAGNLYGTSETGGANGLGTVFKIVKSGTGYNSTPVILASFDGTDGSSPAKDLIVDSAGNLYCTTAGGGANGVGAVVEITGSGFVTCFVTGTRILTARGDVAVEQLEVGEFVVTASGAHRPIRWIGHRDLGGGGKALTHDQQPVRIRAGAFGIGQPARDLLLSPGHPVLVGADAEEDGVLVPIMCLINGTSVAREPRASVTYWHVELDGHDILLAEGLAAESYLDWGDRPFFEDGSDHALHNPDFVAPGLSGRCRRVATDGPPVEAERRRLDARFAAQLTDHSAWPTESADGLSWC